MNKERRDMTHHLRTTRNVILTVSVTLLLAAFALAQDTEAVLHTFTGGRDGAVGGIQLVSDSAGNLYGTTFSGGNNSTGCEVYTGVPGCGVVFKLTRDGHGTWKEKVLHTFSGGEDGGIPVGGVILDSAGNLFGTTLVGGDEKPKVCQGSSSYPPGCGVVFKLTPTAHGPWTERVLYTFTGGKDGNGPWDPLILDSSGNLYGTTSGGGDDSCLPPYGCGLVFKLTPGANGPWKERVLYAFGGGSAGLDPFAGVTFDSEGNLYGVTLYGGDTSVRCYGEPGCGVVYELTPRAHGLWKEKVLHAFKDGTDGAYPLSGVTLDSHGDVYGSALYGGDTTSHNCLGGDGIGAPPGCGVVFRLTPRANGTWAETVLYAFTGGRDGNVPTSPVVFDSSGNLYGMTGYGGDLAATCPFGDEKDNGCGVVFNLRPASKGVWTESVLYAFTGGADGGEPESNLLFDSAGNIYGMTEGGGNTSDCTGNFSGAGCGVVFELTP